MADNTIPAPAFTPDQEREFRTWIEKELAHVDNLFDVTRAAFASGNLRLAAVYAACIADEATAMRARILEAIGRSDAPRSV